ncbi:MAG: hypothetical protein HZA31_07920 [Opitutae bacterium]|nr:hypothetical protein [Opitutae bacterium]
MKIYTLIICLSALALRLGATTYTPSAFTGQAIQDAITNACADTYGGSVHLPAGTYNITAPLTLTSSKNIRIYGDGAANTILRCTAANINVLNFSFTTQAHTAHLRDFTIRADQNCDTAIKITYPSTPTIYGANGLDLEPGNIRHISPGSQIKNVTITKSSTYRFSKGIYLTASWNTRILNCSILGNDGGLSNPTSANAVGAAITFAFRSCNSVVDGGTIANWETGIDVLYPPAPFTPVKVKANPEDPFDVYPHEGIWATGINISKVKYGFRYIMPNGYPTINRHIGGCIISECNITTYSDSSNIGIWAEPTYVSIIRGNYINSSGYGIIYSGEANSITANNLTTGCIVGKYPPVYTNDSTMFERSTGNTINNNNFTTPNSYVIWLFSNVNWNKVVYNQNSNILNQGVNNHISHNP